jgi:hypothetical protein
MTDHSNDREPAPATSPAYFTNASGPGAVRYGQLPGSIGVLESLDKPMPIGIASAIGRTEGGLAVWGLRVHGADVPGQWVIIDRRFVAVEGAIG